MEMDKNYSYIYECPKLGERVSEHQKYHSGGVCHVCGHNDVSTTHARKIIGRWNRPTLYERFFEGKQTEFFRKEDEDALMNKLKG